MLLYVAMHALLRHVALALKWIESLLQWRQFVTVHDNRPSEERDERYTDEETKERPPHTGR